MATLRLDEFLSTYNMYRTARLSFLERIDRAGSNRDPLAEASERLVALLTDGELVPNRVQKDYDVLDPTGQRIQVKYLANPLDKSINGHEIRFPKEADLYAVVVFEDLMPRSVLIFTRESLGPVYDRLAKRHKGRGEVLLLTKANADAIASDPQTFELLGVTVYLLLI